jgi:type IV pilus assembly protein PilB
VLSTLHTNDAPSSVNRLINMGIEPFLVASSMNLIAAQRLVRKICEGCKEPYKVPVTELIEAGFDPADAASVAPFRGRGCSKCGGTGYKGRLGVFEIMEFTEGVRQLVMTNATVTELRKVAIDEGMYTLRQAGLRKVREGVTTMEEVVRETI